MTLDQLAIFVAVAEREHVTRAAESLRLTQSAVSGAIQALEARHAVTLFHRIGRRIMLTQDGRMFLEQARNVLRAAEAAELSLLELQGLKRGAIAMHASQTTGAYWLPERLARFQARYPDIEIKLSIGNTEQVAAAVSSGIAEIGYVEGFVQDGDLVSEQVDIDQLLVVVAAGHPWARHHWTGGRRLKPGQITQSKWILRERGSGTRAVFEQALERLGIPLQQLDVKLELASNEAVRAAVEAGAGATAISRAVVGPALRLKTLYAVPFIPLQRPFLLLRHRDRTLTSAAQAFLAIGQRAAAPG